MIDAAVTLPPDLLDACERIDAALCKGDVFDGSVRRGVLRGYIVRWLRRLEEEEDAETVETCARAPSICTACGHEQPCLDRCGRCGSVRVELVSVMHATFGASWRATFEPDDGIGEDLDETEDGSCPHLFNGGCCELCDAADLP